MPTTVLFNVGCVFFRPRQSFKLGGSGRLVREFLGVLGLNERLQVGKAGGPEGAILLQPGIDGAKRFGIQLVEAVPAFAMFIDQVRPPEQP